MKLLILDSHNPYLNLAIEEYLFRYSEDDVFMLWQNEPSVVIGKNQNAYAEINIELLRKHRVNPVRRITGGGAVYHDLGNVNYTFISAKQSEGIDFAYFTAPIIEALHSLGVSATLSGRNDILIEDKKISGNAQYSVNGRVLHHGTLLFDASLDFLSSVLKVDEEKVKARAIKSTRSRVTNIRPYIREDMTVDGFIKKVSDFVIKKYSPEIIAAPVCDKITELMARNASEEWIFPKGEYLSGYSLIRKRKYPFGLVSISLDMNNDVISAVRIHGDFFGTAPIEELESILTGKRLTDISFLNIEVGDYIFGMTLNELSSLIMNGE